MKQDNLYEKLKELLGKSGGRFSILEDQIDVELQVDFYQIVNKLLKEKRDSKDIISDAEKLYDADTSLDDKKKILAELSDTEKVEAFRIIEKYVDEGDKELEQWSKLALQHCKIGLETYLLDEQKVFISTGLGGKEDKLRYFIAGKVKQHDTFNNNQKKVIRSELEFSFKSNNSVIEQINFWGGYFTVIGLIPFEISIDNIVKEAIKESNNYGNFIHEKFLITNVKILDEKEIEYYFKKKGI